MAYNTGVKPLPLDACIGFEGAVNNGLMLHSNGKTMLYPLGTTIVLRNIVDMKSQEFLMGHTNRVSCISLSKSGRYVASGQVAPMGFPADIIIWDFEARKLIQRLILHKVKVQGVSFSPDEEFLASIGGQDDFKLIIWHVKTGKAVCGMPVPLDHAQVVTWYNNSSTQLITAGAFKLNVWRFDCPNRKVLPMDCHMGTIRRIFLSLDVDEHDEFVYAGTRTGDILQISLKGRLFKHHGPKTSIGQGVFCTAMTPSGDLIVGGGNGSVTFLRTSNMRSVASTKVQGGVTSLALANFQEGETFEVFAGTTLCNIYLVRYDGKTKAMSSKLLQTCHFAKINDITFPAGYSEVFATCSLADIRIWHSTEFRLLLRIECDNIDSRDKSSSTEECYCIAFMPDGKSLISGWSDGKIRAFGPQSGKLLYMIHDAHPEGVTAICGTSDSAQIVSGGVEGQVRVWKIGPFSHCMIASMKEHRAQVNSVQVRKNDSECVSSSNDGSCVVWDMTRYARNQSLYASTFFKAIFYHPDESQLLSTGTDRKVTYWDAYDCQAIRVIDGSLTSEVNDLNISPDGVGFVTGGVDKEVKLWNYDEGHCYYIGRGHSAPITKVRISPDQTRVVSVGEEGAILIWDYKPPISSTPPEDRALAKSPRPGSPK